MMSDDFEKIDLTLPTSDYALVVFHCAQETYQTDSDIECAYTVTPTLQPSNRDWVGIYKVGWRSARDYVCFDWSVIPEGYQKGQRAEVSISFKAANVPKDDGEFYQFCYVTSTGHVRGASTPFQFRQPGSHEYVEVEDDEDEDILVIKTKTAMLEDTLEKAEREKEELSKTIEYLEKEKDSMLEKVIALEKALQSEREVRGASTLELKNTSDKLMAEQEEKQELQLLLTSVKEKITTLHQEKESWVKRLDDNDAYIKSLQDKIKSLVNDKDALVGRNKLLEDEKELFKNHFTSSEGQMKSYLVELETLRRSSHVEEQAVTDLKDQVSSLTEQLIAVQMEVASRDETTQSTQLEIVNLTENLKNCEDKLSAAEHCKTLLNTEVATLRQTFDKLSKDLEEAKSDTYSHKTQVSKQRELIQTYSDRITGLQGALNMKEQELADCQHECLKSKQMVEEQQKCQKVEEEGSLYALKLAYRSLSERYDKVKSTKEEARNHLEDAVHKLKRLEKEKRDLDEDCKTRLRLGQEEYEKRVVECRRLQTELRRALRANKQAKVSGHETETLRRQSSSASVHTQEDANVAGPHSADSQPGASAASGDDTIRSLDSAGDLTEVIVSDTNISLMEQTASELQVQLEHLGQELEKRQSKKNKYKNLYQEEKEKRVYLQQHYFSELKKKDEEVSRLQAQLRDISDDCSQRINTFEGLLEEQKMEMERERKHQQPPVPPFPPQMPYPMPPYVAPAFPPHAAPFYPPQLPPQPITCPPVFSPYHPHPLLTNVPQVPPRVVDLPQPPVVPQVPEPIHVDGPAVDSPNPVTTDSLEFLDPLVNGEMDLNLDAPLQPLPRPLSPQRSMDAQIAEVKAILEGAGTQTNQTEIKETHIDMNEVPALDEEEDDDRFHDAEEGPTQEVNGAVAQLPPRELDSLTGLTLRTCPVCEMVFPAETLERELYRHVESHLGQTCPVCSKTFDETTDQQQYTEHVHSHFNDNE